MADEKKIEPKADSSPKKDPFVEIVSFFIVLLVLANLINGLASSITSSRLFSTGLSGFTPRGILLAHTKPLIEVPNPLNGKVINLNLTHVHDSPGGKKIGDQKMGEKGKVLQGPVVISRMRYWYVDYNSGVDGWVVESDIGYVINEPNIFEIFITGIFGLVWYLKLFVVLLSVVAIVIIVYLIRELTLLRKNERELLYPKRADESSSGNARWERILTQMQSINENDWRNAIIEADIMLSELLDNLFLPGDTIGDKLRAVEESDFTTVEYAREAHKMRNIIAHEGEAFILTEREAKRIIALYKSVFSEFQMI